MKWKKNRVKGDKRFTITPPIIILGIILLILIALIINQNMPKTIEKPSTKMQEKEQKIREPAIAGTWYPGTKDELHSTAEKLLNNVKQIELNGTIKAIIVPHAGWEYSAQTAATAFRQLKDNYDTVIIIGPSHTTYFTGASIADVDYYNTPLGLLKLSDKAKEILKDPNFSSNAQAHKTEHSIEIELPFLQTVLKNFEIIPIVIGEPSSISQLKDIAKTIKKYVDKRTLIVISSDFTHYGPNYNYVPFKENISANLEKLDSGAFNMIKKIDPEGFLQYIGKTGATICGRYPISILLYMLQNESIKARLMYYDTSGHMMNNYKNSVSYLSIVFTTES